jgi:glycosyltransferase involved in cell wall biosynthesis
MQRKIYINGRFLTVPLNGIRRTAYELTRALDRLIDEDDDISNRYKFFIIYSGEIETPIKLKHIEVLKRGVLKGTLWEQIELPIYSFGGLLVSMCTISTLFKRSQVIIVHDASIFVNPQYFSFTFRMWYRLAVPILGKLARHIITVSDFSKKELVKYGDFNEEKTTVIYNAAEHIKDFDQPDNLFIAKIGRYKPYCLAVGSLAVNKNFQGLSKAIKEIKILNHQILIAGSKLSVLESDHQADNLNYLGYVTNAELKYLYSNASLFIFPSFYEGFGIPPLEAMSLGCPVIASNTAAIPEILGDACVYFDPHDPVDMAVKIELLLNDQSKLNELKKTGYVQSRLFSWTNSARRLFKIIAKHSGQQPLSILI